MSIQCADISCNILEKDTKNTQKALKNWKYNQSYTRNTTATRKVKIFGDVSKKAKEIQDLQSHANQETEFTSNKQVYIQF